MINFFFNDTATTEIYTLSYTTLFRSRAAYPHGGDRRGSSVPRGPAVRTPCGPRSSRRPCPRPGTRRPCAPACPPGGRGTGGRKSTRLNSSHVRISYAVFCLKKKKHHS